MTSTQVTFNCLSIAFPPAYSHADDVAPPEVQKQLMDALKWRDQVYRDILKQLQMIPGLSELIENLTEALNACE
jgi:hypothetical protein